MYTFSVWKGSVVLQWSNFPNVTSNLISFQITFYEDRNFMGRSYECMNDMSDMSSYMSRCHSCRVERGCFMVYDRTNYMGNQYFMRRGEYADYMSMFNWSDCIRSCRMIPMVRTTISQPTYLFLAVSNLQFFLHIYSFVMDKIKY